MSDSGSSSAAHGGSGSDSDSGRPAFGLNMATKLLRHAHEAQHRVLEGVMDQIIQDTAVLVSVRVRPMNKREIGLNSKSCVIPTGPGSLKLLETNTSETRGYNFDSVLPERSTQKRVYDLTAKRILGKVLDGFNGCIFAYGQTGSGKTYTMQGLPGLPGVIPRLCTDLFKRIEKAKGKKTFGIKASYVEIYNENIRDLVGHSNNINLREHQKTGTVKMLGCTEVKIESEEDIQKLLKLGQSRRMTGSTNMNEVSSRSHAILTLFLKQVTVVGGTTLTSKLSLIDLAGCERVKNTGATGDRLHEGASINLSLSALGNVVNALTSKKKGKGKKKAHIPYRDSKLTRLLQDSLGGNACTLMICNVSPAAVNVDETLSALRFAKRAKKVQNRAKRNVHADNEQVAFLTAQNLNLREQIERLEAEKQNLTDQNLKKVVGGESSTVVKREDTAATLQKLANLQKQLKIEKGVSTRLMGAKKDLQHTLDKETKDRKEAEREQEELQEKLEALQSHVSLLEQEKIARENQINQQDQEELAMAKIVLGNIYDVIGVEIDPAAGQDEDSLNVLEKQQNEALEKLGRLVKLDQGYKEVLETLEIRDREDPAHVIKVIKRMQKDLDKANRQLEDTKQLHVSLRQQHVAIHTAEKNKLKEAHERLKEGMEELQHKLRMAEETHAQHLDEIDDLKTSMEQVDKEHAATHASVSENLSAVQAEFEVFQDEASRTIKEKEAQITEQKIAMEQMDRELKSASRALDKEEDKSANLSNSVVPDLERTIKRNETLLEQLRAEVEEKKGAMSALEDRVKEQLGIIKNLEAAHAHLRQDHGELEQSSEELQELYNEEISKTKASRREIAALNSRLARLEGVEEKLGSLKEKHDTVSENKRALERENSELKRDLKKAIDERNRVSIEQGEQLEKFNRLKMDNTRTETALKLNQKSSQDRVDKIIAQSKDELKRMEAAAEKAKSDLNTKIAEKQQEIERVTTRLNSALGEQKKLVVLQREINEQKQAYVELEMKYEDMERIARGSQDELAALKVELETSKTSMEKEIRSSNDMKQKRDGEIKVLRDDLASAKTKLSKVKAEYDHLKDKSQADMSGLELKIINLAKDRDSKEQQMLDMEAVNQEKQLEISKLTDTIEMQNDKVRQHAKQTEDFELQKALMETQNSERGKALETMRSKMKQEQTKSAKVGAEIARLEGAIRASERERERVRSQYKFEKQTLSVSFKQTKENLDNQVKLLRNQLDQKKKACDELQTTLANQTQELKSELEKTKRFLQEVNKENSDLVAQSKKVANRSSDLEAELSTALSSWNNDKKGIAALKEEVHLLTTKADQFGTEVEVLKADNLTLKSIQTNLENELNDDMKRLSSLQNTVNEKDGNLLENKNTIRTLEQSIAGKDAIIDTMRKETEGLRGKLTHAEGQTISKPVALDDVPIQLGAVSKLAELESSIQNMNFDNASLKKTLGQTQSELDSTVESLQKSREIAKLEAEKHAKAAAKNRELEATMRASQRELERNKSDSAFSKASLNEKLEQLTKNFESEISQLKTSLAKAEASLKEFQENENRLSGDYQTKMINFQGRNSELEERQQEMTFQIANAKQHEETLLARLKEAEATTMETIQKNAKLTEEVQALELIKINLTMKIETFESNQRNMEAEMSRNLNEMKMLQEKLSNTKSEQNMLADELGVTKAKLSETLSQQQKLEEELEASVAVARTFRKEDLNASLSVDDLSNSMRKSNVRETHQSFLAIQKKFDAADKEAGELRVENAKLQSAADNALKHSKHLKASIESLKEQITKKQGYIKTLETQIHDANMKIDKTENGMIALQQKFANSAKVSAQKLKNLEERLVTDLTMEKRQSKLHAETVENLTQALQAERSKSEEDSELQFSDFSKTVLKLEERVRENEEAVTEVARLRSLLEHSTEMSKDFEEKLQEEKQRNRLLGGQLSDEREKLSKVRKEKRVTDRVFLEMEEKMKHMNQNEQDMGNERELFRKQNEEQISKMEAEIKQHRDATKRAEDEMAQLKSSLQTRRQKVSNLEREVETLKQVLDLRTEENERNQRVVEQLRDEMRESNQEKRKALHEAADMKRRNKSGQHDLIDTVAALKDENKTLHSQLEEVKDQLAAAHISLKEQKGYVKDLQTELQEYVESEKAKVEKIQTLELKNIAIENANRTMDDDEVSAGAWSPKFTPKRLGGMNSPSAMYTNEKLRQSMEEEVSRAKDALEKAKRELKNEKQNKDTIEKMYERVTAQLVTASEEISATKKSQTALERKVQALQRINQQLEEKASENILQMETVRQLADKHKTTAIATDTKNERYEGRIDELERSIKYHKADVRKLHTDIAAFKSKEAEWKDTEKQLQTLVQNLEGRIANTTKSSREESRALKSKKREDQTIIDIIHGILNAHQIAILTKHHGGKREHRDLMSYVRMLVNSIDEDKKAWEEEKEKLEAKCKYMESSMGRLHDAKSTIDQHLGRFEKTSKILRQRVAELEAANGALSKENSEAKSECKEQESLIGQLKDSLATEQRERNDARNAIKAAMDKSAARITECKALQSRISDLDEKLRAAVVQNRTLLNQLQEMSTEIKKSRKQVAAMKQEKEQYAANERDLRATMSMSVKNLQSVRGEEGSTSLPPHPSSRSHVFGYMGDDS